ncbi:MAG: 2-oxoglutarate dehydrogenase E2 component (dihydrolipoamide succinyltransferase) [Saprospiraceae bacterium]|jgi:2-oxoglutarate dehydrogenase E2 component (dihydrolipoamide succinyltransferase)
MAQVELIMPKMGESITEATILEWLKKPGDTVEMDENVLLIATDKVDSEVPSSVAGTIVEILYEVDAVVAVGKPIAIIATEGEAAVPVAVPAAAASVPAASTPQATHEVLAAAITSGPVSKSDGNGRFYSPLVRTMAEKENISMTELTAIGGSGKDGRVTKKDMLAYIANRGNAPQPVAVAAPQMVSAPKSAPAPRVNSGGDTEIVEMDRMRRLIADHMVMSKHTSPHVTSFIEADVTNMVNWRNKVKGEFQKKHGQKITFTPIILEAVTKAILDFPMINVSVDGTNIIVHKNINVGMAAALPSGNLIVPVIKNADEKNLLGLTKAVNDLAGRARANKLKPAEVQGGTFTVTNVGTFGNVMGTPIINQPQAAIMAAGAIRKKPAVLETEYGDVIAIRQMMFLSLSYDHRVVDGFLGGSFLRRIGDYLEAFDDKQTI